MSHELGQAAKLGPSNDFPYSSLRACKQPREFGWEFSQIEGYQLSVTQFQSEPMLFLPVRGGGCPWASLLNLYNLHKEVHFSSKAFYVRYYALSMWVLGSPKDQRVAICAWPIDRKVTRHVCFICIRQKASDQIDLHAISARKRTVLIAMMMGSTWNGVGKRRCIQVPEKNFFSGVSIRSNFVVLMLQRLAQTIGSSSSPRLQFRPECSCIILTPRDSFLPVLVKTAWCSFCGQKKRCAGRLEFRDLTFMVILCFNCPIKNKEAVALNTRIEKNQNQGRQYRGKGPAPLCWD